MKKKLTQLRWLVTMLLFVTAIAMPKIAWAEITPTKPGGDGTSAKPYQIGTAEELYWFAALVNGDTSVDGVTEANKTACAKLTANIVVNTGVLKSDGSLADNVSELTSWTPINSDEENFFTGTFDGCNHTISGLYVNNASSNYVGLFGITNGAVISNLGIVDSYICGNLGVAAVCGYCLGEGGSITNCYNTGIVKGEGYVGGICGYSSQVVIEKCHNTGNIIGTSTNKEWAFTGGICGGIVKTTITKSYNTGDVRGNFFVGGICGSNGFEYSNDLTYCYNTGTIDGPDNCKDEENTGGIAGYNGGNIKYCYNIGTVSGGKYKGNICGINGRMIAMCIYIEKADGLNAVGSGKGQAEVQAKTSNQFASGEVALLLNGGKTDGSQAWYQNLSAESKNEYPILTSTGENTVYGGYQHGKTTIYYSNSASDYPHAHAYDYSATDEANGNHDMTYQGVFTWADNDDKTNATVTATFTCKVCGKIVTPEAMTVEHDDERPNTEATCTEKGYNYYKTSYSFTGETFSSAYTQTLRALGHDMNAITFNEAQKIYSNQCQRDGCDHIGYYATSDGSVKATYEDGVYKVPFLCLNDGLAYDSKAQYTVTSLEYKRMYSHDKWVAVYVPFAIDCSKLPDDMEMATINNFHEYEQEGGSYNVVLEVKRKTSGTIPALTPCVMRLKTAPIGGETETYTMLFSNAMFSPAADDYVDCSSVTRYYKFTGSLAGIAANNFNGDTDFVLNEGTLHKANTETTLKAQRWYLSATDRNISGTSSSAMLRSISLHVIGDGDVTGIENVHVVTEKVKSVRDGIFDLQGRRLNSEPTNGIYIKNGVKYVK